MSTKVIMPQMGESIFEGTITKWLKQIGDTVARDEPLFEISTDKVDSEIPSPSAGVLREILVQEGETVQINTVVALIAEGETSEDITGEGPKEAAAEETAIDQPDKVPQTQQPRDDGPAPSKAGVEESAEPSEPLEPMPGDRAESVQETPTIQPRDVRTSPLVRRLARQHKIDLSKLRGTGLSGRITRQDVENYLESREDADQEPTTEGTIPAPEEPARTSPAPAAVMARAEGTAGPETPVSEPPGPGIPAISGEVTKVPLTTMRKSIADHMVLSKRTSAHVHTVFHVDLTEIVGLRSAHKAEFEAREGIRLTYTPFFVKALVDTVREFPILNSSFSEDSIVYKKAVNVGVAVALESGLIVPVVKNAHLKSFTGIAIAISDLAERARTKKLIPDDVQQGTITVTNPGVYGSVFATPIINQPQVAILGVGGIEKRPVVIRDGITIRSMVYLTLSFDHRVIDGAVADQSMAALKGRLESWSRWTE